MIIEEKIYEVISEYLISYAKDDQWDQLTLESEIYGRMVKNHEILVSGNKVIDEYREIPIGLSRANTKSILELRDGLIEMTGDRIWGLKFTLYSDGKFSIEYNYSKPDGYEETEEIITGEEINKTFLK